MLIIDKVTNIIKEYEWGKNLLINCFDEGKGDETTEAIGVNNCSIDGHKSLWRSGISGTALQFDGYNTVITCPAAKAPQPVSQISLEGWVAIGAYPWSYVPIIQQSDDVPEEIEELRRRRLLELRRRLTQEQQQIETQQRVDIEKQAILRRILTTTPTIQARIRMFIAAETMYGYLICISK